MMREKLKLAIDVYYTESLVKVVGIIFNNWTDDIPHEVIERVYPDSEPNSYIPGEFYKRELPYIFKILQLINLKNFDFIVLDSFIDLKDYDNRTWGGLGRKLWEIYPNLNIIGVAKSNFGKTNEISESVLRGEAIKPLYVQGLGLSNKEAAKIVYSMSGNYRIPNLLKQLDKLTKNWI